MVLAMMILWVRQNYQNGNLQAQIIESALPAADAESCKTEFFAAALKLIHQRQNQACARRSNRMAQRDRATVDVQLIKVETADGFRQIEFLLRKLVALERACARQDLSRKSFVQFVVVHVR